MPNKAGMPQNSQFFSEETLSVLRSCVIPQHVKTRKRENVRKPPSIDILTIVQAILNATPSSWSRRPTTVMAIPLH